MLGFAEQGLWGEALDRIDEQPELAAAIFDFGNTVLIDLASFPRSSAVLLRLIELGANVNHRADTGLTAVEQAVSGGSKHALSTLDELRLLLERGADPTVIGSTGVPLLQLAIEQNRLEHARLLLEHGADPFQTSPDFSPETALDVAKRARNTAAIELLGQFDRPA